MTLSLLESQWEPIETAPSDGAYLLLWDGHDMEVGHWCKALNPGYKDHWTVAGDEYGFDPTHWMPLPEPPC